MCDGPTVGDVVKAISRGENPFAKVQTSQVTLYGCYIDGCQFQALSEPEVNAHMLEHGIYTQEPTSSKSGTRQLRCSECPETFINRRLFIRHAEEEHGLFLPIFTKTFEDQKSFDEWLKYLRQHHLTDFVSRCGKKRMPNGDILGYMLCSRDGLTTSKGSGRSGKKPTKCGKTCAAHLKFLAKKEGSIEVEGCIDHTGHELKPNSEAALTKEERQLMVDWLKENVPIKEICRRLEERRHTGTFTCKTEIEDEPDSNDPYSGFCFPYASASSLSTSFVNFDTSRDYIHFLEEPGCPIKTEESIPSTEFSEVEPNPQTQMSRVLSSMPGVSSFHQERNFVVPYVNVSLEKRKLEMLDSFQNALRQINEQTIDASESALAFFLGELAGIQKQA